MPSDIQSIVEDFEFLDEWEDKYRYVIELGKSLPDFDDAWRTGENKVNGCVSQVWLHSNVSDDDRIVHFEGDSDAHIVRGLVAIMIAAMSDRRAQDIVEFDAEALLAQLGLDSHLTPQRSNGLRAMVTRMKNIASSSMD